MPKNKTAVRRLLGMANQYRNHIFRYAKIVDPLCRLTEGEWPTRWDSESVPEECHTALEKLKTALTSPAVLSKPDPKLPYELHVDASDTGIAGKLNQIEPSSDVQDESNITPTPKERLIACVSRSLSKQERKWAAHEKEALAVIWSLEKFRTYLCAAEFTIYTDHRNLLWLLNLDADKGRLSRWATLMAPWQIKAVTPKELKEGKIEQHKGRIIVHRPGKDMQIPDCLSRMYDVDDGGQEPTKPNNLILNLTGDLQEPPKMPTLVEVAEAQKTDKFCQIVLSD